MAEGRFSGQIRHIGTTLLTLGFPCVQPRAERGRCSNAASLILDADQLAAWIVNGSLKPAV